MSGAETDETDDQAARDGNRRTLILRCLALGVVALAIAVVWFTHQFLTDRYSQTTRSRSELRLALYTGNLMSELQRSSVVPILLSRDPALTGALDKADYSVTSQRLIDLQSELGTAALMLLDENGRVVASSDRKRLGTTHSEKPYFQEAAAGRETMFTSWPRDEGGYGFSFSRSAFSEGFSRGVIVVEVDLAKYERAWSGWADAVAVMDSDGTVVLATEPRWRGLTLPDALKVRDAPTALQRAFQMTADWTQSPADVWLSGEAVMQVEARVPFRGWQMVMFSRYDTVREKVNTFLALEIMGFALLLAGGFYWLSRQARSQSRVFQRESEELRRLAARLRREIAERERMQQNLAVAEQTLAQSSKLAVLGEMSAAVSHELNQPLAAMKTYLAGARLLLQRRKGDEALASFQRIDDLIDRMGTITRQLKSYARKGGEAFAPVDFKACISEALAMMEPQLKTRRVRINRQVPKEPVMIMADRIRLEQVIINLLRNALDATRDVALPQIDLIVTTGDTARLVVSDNGPGISDLDNLFEPFWTTKKPGEGVGLGLAISSGIVADLGGRLTARNGEQGGAIFDLQLPLIDKTAQAAE